MKGFINIIKPVGMSSAKAVTAVKKAFNLPCGHMGTLDPMAQGVLPVGIYKTTRLFPYLLTKQKTYVAEFTFGATTDTLDATGRIVDETSFLPSEESIKASLGFFIGEISQVPPKYSAKNVDGKRGYELARKGVEFELAPKNVVIDNFEFIEKTGERSYSFKIECKGGTYIRSLCRDLALKVGSLGYMSKLSRVQCGLFNMENGVTVDEFINSTEKEKYILSADIAVDFDKLVLTNEQATKILNGVYENYGFSDGIYRVYNCDDFWGVGKVQNGVLHIDSYVR